MKSQCATLARRWFEEVWNQDRPHTIDELMAPNGVGHLESGDIHGPEGFKSQRLILLNAFPKLKFLIEAVVADEEHAVVRWSASGTHKGDALGIRASGRKADFRGMTWLRFENGRIVEGWDSWNQGALLQSLT